MLQYVVAWSRCLVRAYLQNTITIGVEFEHCEQLAKYPNCSNLVAKTASKNKICKKSYIFYNYTTTRRHTLWHLLDVCEGTVGIDVGNGPTNVLNSIPFNIVMGYIVLQRQTKKQ